MDNLLEAGWTNERKVKIPDHIQQLNPSDEQIVFFESFYGLSVTDIRGNKIDFKLPLNIKNIAGETVNLFKVSLETIADLAYNGIELDNAIPVCDLPYAQDLTRIVVDRNLNFFNIYIDEACYLGNNPWWAFQHILNGNGCPNLYLGASGMIETELGKPLFEL